jgi:hypothetical protein
MGVQHNFFNTRTVMDTRRNLAYSVFWQPPLFAKLPVLSAPNFSRQRTPAGLFVFSKPISHKVYGNRFWKSENGNQSGGDF